MSGRLLEARALIVGEDRLTPMLDAIEKKIATISRMSREVGRASGSVSGAGSSLAAMGEIAKAERALGSLGSVLNRVASDADRAARAMSSVARHSNAHAAVDRSGRQIAMGIAGGYIAHTAAHFAGESLETYREFDKERRYARAVMGITDEQQQPLIDQAIHGGATSKFNDIQWLEAQRELAARGLNVQQVLGITGIAANLGQAMDRTLPEASRLLEGGMFGFGKDISTYEKARANALRTADLQVKASKISGMDAEDVQAAYKYSAAPFRMGGLSEEQMLAFAAVGKKANMPGDEMGTAGRALIANLLKPTAGARTAMLANGIDFSRYQKLGDRPMEVGPFAQSIAASYGVALSDKAKEALQRVFNNKALVRDAGKFMPKIMEVLSASLGGDDAKSKKSIAGEARRYRDAAMSGVDAQALFNALIPAVAKNPALANLVFGSKQGARIRTAIGDPDVFLKKLDELINHSQGYAKDIADQRMSGFDGAMSRLEGATKNLETALGRAFDANGKGGFLTGATDTAGRFVQALAEAPPNLQRLGAAAAVTAATFAGLKGVEALAGGFGLKGAAAALVGSAEALTAAAGKQALANGLPGVSEGGKGWKYAGRLLKTLPLIATLFEAGEIGLDYMHEHEIPPGPPKAPGEFGFKQPMVHRPNPSDHVVDKAKEAKAALDAVGQTKVKPQADTSALDGMLAKINAVLAGLRSIGGAATSAQSAVRGINSAPMNLGTGAPGLTPRGRTPTGQ